MKELWRSWLLLVVTVLAGSWLAVTLRGGKEESRPAVMVRAEAAMTVADFVRANAVTAAELQQLPGGLAMLPPEQALATAGKPEQLAAALIRQRALAAEAAAKPWLRISVKFLLWIIALVIAGRAIRSGSLTPARRRNGYLLSVLIFGVALGADPSPMGTVKDAIVLFGGSGAVFPPRLAAFVAFMLMVIVVNKFICAWGCQFGVLQDAIFRLGRNAADGPGAVRQYRPAFALTNGIRVIFFLALTALALAAGIDLVAPVDPFKIFSPTALSAAGGLFVFVLLAAAVFIYRPWCHLFCPFGLVGWLGEQFSRIRIRIDRGRCIRCGACVRACPSTVMAAILRGSRLRPDCFSCGSCLPVCPTRAVTFSRHPSPVGPQQPAGKSRGRG